MSTNVTDRNEIVKAVRSARRRRKFWDGVRKVLTSYLTNVLMGLVDGWMLMIAIGVAHAEWVPGLPTIGYWPSVILVVLLRGVFSNMSKSDKSEVRS